MARKGARVEYVPARGDVVRITFDPVAGHEQAGRRPAVVLSPLDYNKRVGLVIVCPITKTSKGYPFEVVLPDDLRPKVYGVVLADQPRTLDWRARVVEFVCPVTVEIMAEITARLLTLVDDS